MYRPWPVDSESSGLDVVPRSSCSSRNVHVWGIIIILNNNHPWSILILTFLTYPRLAYPYPYPTRSQLPFALHSTPQGWDDNDTEAECTRGEEEDIDEKEVCSSGDPAAAADNLSAAGWSFRSLGKTGWPLLLVVLVVLVAAVVVLVGGWVVDWIRGGATILEVFTDPCKHTEYWLCESVRYE